MTSPTSSTPPNPEATAKPLAEDDPRRASEPAASQGTPSGFRERPRAALTPPDAHRSSAPSATRHARARVGFKLRVSGVETVARGAVLLARAGARHGLGRIGDVLWGARFAEERRAARIAATVSDLVGMLGALKGAFVKVGQFALVRHDLVPESTAEGLATLRSQVPPLPFPVIREAVETELGDQLETLFAEFAEQPLGAASVAQVHWARLPDGQQVAVKVQYPWVEQSLASDLWWLQLALRFVTRWLGRDVPSQETLFREFETGLREELDFEREARVAREIAANLESEPQVAVPEILESHSSRRVLTMTYCDAVPVDDRDALVRIGASPRAVLEILGRAYAKQIFADGLFHADPHPGNLFVIDEPGAGEQPRILFVDFGLSQRLSPTLRKHLRVGVYALIQGDLDAFVAEIDAMGMISPGAQDEVRSAVGAMFERIAGEGGGLRIPGGAILGLKDEAVELLRETEGLQLPNDVLLYARTLSYLFQLGETLDPEVDLLELSTPYLLKFLAGRD